MKRTEWYPLLPPELLRAAYKAGNELAWPKEQALQVIDVLKENGCAVNGVEVWIPTNPGPTIPTPFVYDWVLKEAPRGDNYPNTPEEFIENFSWDSADKSHADLAPVFNISAIKA